MGRGLTNDWERRTPDHCQPGCGRYLENIMEELFFPAVQVEGTDAAALLPAIRPCCIIDMENVDSCARISGCVNTVTIAPLCDQAGANVSLQKRWCRLYLDGILERTEGRILYDPDLCQAC